VLFIIILCGLFALVVDIGRIMWTRGQLQNAADAAALAGAGTLFWNPDLKTMEPFTSPYVDDARIQAQVFVQENVAAQFGPKDPPLHLNRPLLDINRQNDVVVGHWKWPSIEPDETFPNAVQVTVRAEGTLLFGYYARTQMSQATATAKIQHAALLPFTMYEGAWGEGSVRMYPGPWDGTELPPGNFGTLHIGPDGGGTATLRDQIADGVSYEDITSFGRPLAEVDMISGDTGLSAGMEVAFLGGEANGREYPGIIGEIRYLPLYNMVSGNGNNAQFTIVQFVTVRVTAVDLHSPDKYVQVEPVEDLNKVFGLKLVK
jgi:hypothetical protein